MNSSLKLIYQVGFFFCTAGSMTRNKVDTKIVKEKQGTHNESHNAIDAVKKKKHEISSFHSSVRSLCFLAIAESENNNKCCNDWDFKGLVPLLHFIIGTLLQQS